MTLPVKLVALAQLVDGRRLATPQAVIVWTAISGVSKRANTLTNKPFPDRVVCSSNRTLPRYLKGIFFQYRCPVSGTNHSNSKAVVRLQKRDYSPDPFRTGVPILGTIH